MSANVVDILVEQQLGLITGIIRETRILIGDFKSLESVAEDRVGSLKPLLGLAKDAFEKLEATGFLNSSKIVQLRDELDLLQEETDELEQPAAIYAGLAASGFSVPKHGNGNSR